jgi:hypothetical protein
MNDILINVISIVVTSVVIPLISIGGTQLIRLINSKIKNNEVNKHLTLATEIVINAVRSVFQTYVESLKAEGKFDEASQILALKKAKDIALSQMSSEVRKFIEDNYGDINYWLNIQIEASINCLKSKSVK